MPAEYECERRKRLYTPTAADRVELGVADIEKLIPHRDPFRFVDRIDAHDADHIAGRRYVDPADPLFVGHFPGEPIYPGVLQIEAMGQLGICHFALHRSRDLAPVAGVRAFKIHGAVFLAPVHAGDVMELVAKSLDVNDYTGTCAGQVIVNGTICCSAVMEVYFVEA